MRLERITIKNFLSIKKLELDLSNLTIFVGPNNHGKTNILKALDFFFYGTKLTWEDLVTHNTDDDISVICEFSNVEPFIPLLNPKHQERHKEYIINGNISFERRYVKKAAKPENFKVYDVEAKSAVDITGITNANTMMPRYEFIPTKMTMDETAKIQKTNYLGRMIFDIFDKITPEEDKQYLNYWKEIENYFNNRESGGVKEITEIEELIFSNLKENFPDCEKVNLKAELPKIEDIIKGFKIRIKEENGEDTDISYKGDGMQRATMFSIIKSYADFERKRLQENAANNKDEKNKLKSRLPIIFAIDEIELHLHPQSQKDIYNNLKFLSDNTKDQVLFTTHSNIISKKEENNKIYAIKKVNGHTEKLDDNKTSLFSLLGICPSDYEFPDNILIVEGESDKKFTEKLFELMDIGKKINIHFSGGDSNIVNAGEAINQMLRTCFYVPFYKETICAIFDKQTNQRNINDFKKYICDNDDKRILELDKNGIEYFYPKSILAEFFDEKDVDFEQEIKKFLEGIKNSQNLKNNFGKLRDISKRDLSDQVISRINKQHLSEIDQELKAFILRVEELAY